MIISNNNNINFGIKYRKIPQEQLEKLLNSGRSYEEIGKIYNMPKHNIFRLAKCYDIKTRSQILKEKKYEKIIELYCQGVPLKNISYHVNAKLDYVKKVLKEFIDKHTPKPRESYSDPIVSSIIEKLKINKKSIEDSLL